MWPFKKKIKLVSKVGFKYPLGSTVKDAITGYEGVVVSRTQWLNACNVYGLQSKQLKDGKVVERQHFDEPQLELVSGVEFKAYRETGGPADSSPQTNR